MRPQAPAMSISIIWAAKNGSALFRLYGALCRATARDVNGERSDLVLLFRSRAKSQRRREKTGRMEEWMNGDRMSEGRCPGSEGAEGKRVRG